MPYTISMDPMIDLSVDYGGNQTWFSQTYRLGQPGADLKPNVLPFVVNVGMLRGHAHPPPVYGETRILLLSHDVVQIIEALEPNVHDFVPFELRYGTPIVYQVYPYFAARVNQSFDGVDLEASDVTLLREDEAGNMLWSKKPRVPLVLIDEKVRGKHLWIFEYLFCSDELHEKLQSQHLTLGWVFEKQHLASEI